MDYLGYYKRMDELQKLFDEVYIEKVNKLDRKFYDWMDVTLNCLVRITALEAKMDTIEEML